MGNCGRRVSALSVGCSYVNESSEPMLMEVLIDSSIISEKEHILMFWTMLPLSSGNIKS